jgi:hypothetical protein
MPIRRFLEGNRSFGPGAIYTLYAAHTWNIGKRRGKIRSEGKAKNSGDCERAAAARVSSAVTDIYRTVRCASALRSASAAWAIGHQRLCAPRREPQVTCLVEADFRANRLE